MSHIVHTNVQLWMGRGLQLYNDPNVPWYNLQTKKRGIIQYDVNGLRPRMCCSKTCSWEDIVNELKWQDLSDNFIFSPSQNFIPLFFSHRKLYACIYAKATSN